MMYRVCWELVFASGVHSVTSRGEGEKGEQSVILLFWMKAKASSNTAIESRGEASTSCVARLWNPGFHLLTAVGTWVLLADKGGELLGSWQL